MNRFRRSILTAGCLAAVGGAANVLYRFPPGEYSFYPQCPIHALFGIQCPGCGATRALASLLHGQVLEAWHFNALIVALLPIVLTYSLFYALRALRELPPPRLSIPSIYALSATVLIFGVARNF